MALTAGIDVLVHDAQHRASDFPSVDYLGHSSAEYAVALAKEAGVGTVVLYHHDPLRTDEQVDALAAQVGVPGVHVIAAFQGLVLDIDEDEGGVRSTA